jgi:hypothetical protein
MLKRTAILSVLAAIFVWTSPASALMIDDFARGGTNLAIDDILDTDAWWSLENGLPNANTYGQKRYTQLDWQPDISGNPGDWATIDVNDGGSGVADFNRIGDPRWWFGYGERAFDFTWDKDWSGPGEDLLKITLGGNGAPEILRINFYIHGTIGGVAKYLNDDITFDVGQTVGYYDLRGLIPNPQSVDVPALRNHVTGMAVYYVAAENTDTDHLPFTLDTVELVPIPEPATMSLLTLGAIGLLARKRRTAKVA